MTNAPAKSGNPIIYTCFILILAVTACSAYLFFSRPHIAYVRTSDLVYGYNGMRDAHSTYKSQSDVWQANIDTLKMQYQRCLADYQSTYSKLSDEEKREKGAMIKKLEDNLKNYSSVIREQAEEKEKTMTEAVINQINSYVEEYAKKNGYDFVIGSNNGNLVYGNKRYDITDEVLTAINKEYKIMPAPPKESAPEETLKK